MLDNKNIPQSYKTSTDNTTGNSLLPLLHNNFVLMAVAGIMIVLGFILIAGAPSGTDQYNPDIFSGRRIVVGPMLSFLGFVLMAVAIIIKPKAKK